MAIQFLLLLLEPTTQRSEYEYRPERIETEYEYELKMDYEEEYALALKRAFETNFVGTTVIEKCAVCDRGPNERGRTLIWLPYWFPLLQKCPQPFASIVRLAGPSGHLDRFIDQLCNVQTRTLLDVALGDFQRGRRTGQDRLDPLIAAFAEVVRSDDFVTEPQRLGSCGRNPLPG